MDEPFCVLVLSWFLFNPFTVSFVSAIVSVLVAYTALGGVQQTASDVTSSSATSTTPSVAFIQLTSLATSTTIKYPVDNTILGNLSDTDKDSSQDFATSTSTAQTEVPATTLEASIDTFKLMLLAIIAVATFLIVFVLLNVLKYYYKRRRRTSTHAKDHQGSSSYDQERHERAPLLEEPSLSPVPGPSGTKSGKFYGTDSGDVTKES